METAEYRARGRELVDYIAGYLENIREEKVRRDTTPGFLQKVIPWNAPKDGEDWVKILGDIETLIMPGCVHWQSPSMNAYFPAMGSFPSMIGDMVTVAIDAIPFTYAACPAATELEMTVMNWVAKMIELPEDFMHKKGGTGGGVIQTTASESTLVSLLASRGRAIKNHQAIDEDAKPWEILSKLVAYTSDQAHCSVEKGARIGFVPLRHVESDGLLSMRGPALLEMMKKDRENGLIPFWVCATLGTTSSCAFDNLAEIVEVCEGQDVWVHVDAAYAGNAFICPEFRKWWKGVEHVDSVVFDAPKGLLTNTDCSLMWVKDGKALHEAFVENPQYLHHEYTGLAVDFMNWQIPLSRKFRALKLWCVIRNYGVEGLQKCIRHTVNLAEEFEALVRSDSRFEVPFPRHLGLVVFALTAGEAPSEMLLQRINQRGKSFCDSAKLKHKYVIRFVVESQHTTMDDITAAWKEIQAAATEVLADVEPDGVGIEALNASSGRCLLLSNTVGRASIIDGSCLARHGNEEELQRWFQSFKLN